MADVCWMCLDAETSQGYHTNLLRSGIPTWVFHGRYWPGSEATLQIIDPAYRKMYDDILMSIPGGVCGLGEFFFLVLAEGEGMM